MKCTGCDEMTEYSGACDHAMYSIVWYTEDGMIAWCTRCGALMIDGRPHCDECRLGKPEKGLWQKAGRCSMHRTHRMQETITIPETFEMIAQRLKRRGEEDAEEWLIRIKSEYSGKMT